MIVALHDALLTCDCVQYSMLEAVNFLRLRSGIYGGIVALLISKTNLLAAFFFFLAVPPQFHFKGPKLYTNFPYKVASYRS